MSSERVKSPMASGSAIPPELAPKAADDGWGEQLQGWVDGGAYRHYANLRIHEDLFEKQRFASFLDVGCGAGTLVQHFRDRGVVCVGLDNSPMILDYHSRQRMVPIVAGSIDELPFEDSRFEQVTCLGLIEHLSDPLSALTELKRVTHPGGRAIITVPRLFGPFPFLVPLWFYSGGRYRFGWTDMVGSMYTRRKLRRQLQRSGWRVREIRAFKASSLLEWMRLPYSRRLAEFVERNSLISKSLGIMLVAICTNSAGDEHESSNMSEGA